MNVRHHGTTTGLSYPQAVAVDGAGNVYFNTGSGWIEEWCVASNALITLANPGSVYAYGLALDPLGNIYISDGDLVEQPHAYLVPAPILEGFAAGEITLPAVVPAAENLLPPFAPTTDQSWLTMTGITNDMVSFSFTSTSSNRTAHLTLLGEKIR